jgi:hypothetical protein
MNLVEFFDPRNLDHIKAYKHLCDKGKYGKNKRNKT